MSYRIYELQLTELGGWPNGQSIISAGGAVIVVAAGGAAKVTLYDPDDFSALDNPVSFTRGKLRFATADSVEEVDLYGVAPSGHALSLTGVKPGGNQDWFVDTAQREQVLKIPFSIEDTSAATETDTGIDLPLSAAVKGGVGAAGILVTTADDSATIDVGTAQALSPTPDPVGDADGLQDGVSLTNAVMVTATDGALISTNVPFMVTDSVQHRVTYTLNAGTDTGEGFIIQPYVLPT